MVALGSRLPTSYSPVVLTEGREAKLLANFIALVIEKRARMLGLPWIESPQKTNENIAKALLAFWAAFPSARFLVEHGVAQIVTGKHDRDAVPANPLSEWFSAAGDRLIPRVAI
jgi:hypothetical protein